MDHVFHALLPRSRNFGDFDVDAFAEGTLFTEEVNPQGMSILLRAGDTVASRNVHAAIFDALRMCKDP
jgi:hypothetical protein